MGEGLGEELRLPYCSPSPILLAQELSQLYRRGRGWAGRGGFSSHANEMGEGLVGAKNISPWSFWGQKH